MKRALTLKSLWVLCTLLLFFSCSEPSGETVPWVPLFDGQTLNGWQQQGGEANYTVRDNSIVGSSVHDTPNSFLTTDARYGDFILELDVKVDTTIQFRDSDPEP